jgi:Domain of unknown function (DUF4410)
MKYLIFGFTMVCGSLLLTGCSSTRSVAARPLEPSFLTQGANLSKYTVATVQPFDVPNSEAANDQAGQKLATDIANRLNYDFGPLFRSVRVGAPMGTPDELIIGGRITDYRPGSRAARLFGPGIGSAHLKGDVVLRDGPTGQVLMAAPIQKLWAWGHSLGAAKGMPNMLDETAASAANMVARAKGWEGANQASVYRARP